MGCVKLNKLRLVSILELFRELCPGLGKYSWFLHYTLAHISDNIRLVGKPSDYSIEALEAGHAWMRSCGRFQPFQVKDRSK